MWFFCARLVTSVIARNLPTVCKKNNRLSFMKNFMTKPKTSLHTQPLHSQKFATLFQQHGFHTSSRRPVPPVLLILLKPIAKFSAVLTGRGIRKWFQALSPNERKKVLTKLRRYWYIPAGLVSILSASGVVYYVSHLEDTPVTGRRRFVALTHEQIIKIAQAEANMLKEQFKDKLYPINSIEAYRVLDVAERLLRANPELSQMKFDKWNVYVIKDPMVNACVLPTGDMFVFNGILEIANTQDQLAIILGHEMAHAVLEHGVEELSLASLVDVLVIFSLAALWCIIPSDGIAVITHWFYNKVIKLLTHMPHSRKVEKEADCVGLMFAAKACFDVRAGSLLWNKMSLHEKISSGGDDTLPEFMSTHPDSLQRAEHLDFLLPQAEKWRNENQCPMLPKNDPREAIKLLSILVDNQIAATKAGQDLRKVSLQPGAAKAS
ncbi:metalloendopeptidase oma1, mitochondrial [Plakobranchus ocellatus]|uniref:Metalloendopeptidase OMA1, mitochondrial n=1 Tax=Plakobranchus ocellatus TaxID=259542 RepID=A0AAV4A761_9GAST|nr:metalloendopeptidase oma1, mitochondrial [Plakobranchus ocellatus]